LFENSVLRRIFGPKREEVTEGWQNAINEELHNLCSSNTVKVTKSWRIAGHITHMGR
jgi:hypothetical protein